MTIDYRILASDEVVSKGVFSVSDNATYEEIEDIAVNILEDLTSIEWKYSDEDENWR